MNKSLSLRMAALALPIFLCCAWAQADGVHSMLVRDILTSSSSNAGSSSPNWFVMHNGIAYFNAYTAKSGTKLWRSDGTEAGTSMVKAASYPNYSNPLYPVNFNGAIYLQMTDPATGAELWRSDGTSTGTVLLKDINPGNGGSMPYMLTVNRDTLYFFASERNGAYGLWKSDGTTSGTVLVRPLMGMTSNQGPLSLIAVGGTLFFLANDGVHGVELWKSDGTPEGTMMVKDIHPGSSGVDSFFYSGAQYFYPYQGCVYFGANDGVHGAELWKSDGTPEGTMMVMDINPGSENGVTLSGSQDINAIAEFSGELYFTAQRSSSSSYVPALWKTNGTPAGTVQVCDKIRGNYFTVMNGALYFTGTDSANSVTGLFKTDGQKLTALCNGGSSFSPRLLAAVKSTLYFYGYAANRGTTIWKSDGTTAGTRLLTDYYPFGSSMTIGHPKNFFDFNGRALFTGFDRQHNRELWISDGTTQGTAMVRDIAPPVVSSIPQSIVPLDNKVLFTAYRTDYNRALWASDGTGLGTIQISSSTLPMQIAASGGKVFFSYNVSGTGDVLCTAEPNATAGANSPVTLSPPLQLYGMSGYRYISTLTQGPSGQVYFSTRTSVDNKMMLWVSDGTDAGTQGVSLDEFKFTQINQLRYTSRGLFLVGTTADRGSELWRAHPDGSNLTLLRDINPTTATGTIGSLCEVNGVVYFGADEGVHGMELWRSDGTAAGTVMVADITPGPEGSFPKYFQNGGDRLYFSASDPDHGTELWSSDGTAGNTRLVKDIVPGPESSFPTNLLQSGLGNPLLFTAYHPDHGVEIWSSDGTAAGTNVYEETLAGDDALNPQFLTVSGGKLFFSGYEDTHGRELWALPLAPAMKPEPPFTKGLSNTVQWDPWPGAAGYTVQRSTTADFSGSPVLIDVAANTTQASLSGLQNGYTYFYRVRARLTGGNTTFWSGGVSSSQDNLPPTCPAPTATADFTKSKMVIFSWGTGTDPQPGSGIVRYDCQVGTAPNGTANVFNGDAGLTRSLVVTGTPDTTLYARVRAIDAVGNVGDWSPYSSGIAVDVPPLCSSLTVTPAVVRTNDSVTAIPRGTDSDPGDTIAGYRYEWIQGGVVRSTNQTLDASLTARGQYWVCQVWAKDNHGVWSATPAQAGFYIANSQPNQPLVEIRPKPAKAGDGLSVALLAPAIDPDGDPVAYYYDWSCSKDGGKTWTYPSTLDHASGLVPGAQVAGGDLWRVTCRSYEKGGMLDSATLPAWDQAYIGQNNTPVLILERPLVLKTPTGTQMSIGWSFGDADGETGTVELEWTSGKQAGYQRLARSLPVRNGLYQINNLPPLDQQPVTIHGIFYDPKGAMGHAISAPALVLPSTHTLVLDFLLGRRSDATGLDLNGDKAVNVADVVRGLAAYGTPQPPSSPAPADGTGSVLDKPTLSWAASARAQSYELWIWPVKGARPAKPAAASLLQNKYLVPAALQKNAAYYWQVIAVSGPARIAGPIWRFTTRP